MTHELERRKQPKECIVLRKYPPHGFPCTWREQEGLLTATRVDEESITIFDNAATAREHIARTVDKLRSINGTMGRSRRQELDAFCILEV